MQKFIKNLSRVLKMETGSKSRERLKSPMSSGILKKFILFFTLSLLPVSAGIFAQTVTPSITIVNNTGYAIFSVYISTTASEDWGSNRLGSDQILDNVHSISLPLPYALNVTNRYDIRLKDKDGDIYTKRNVLVSANSRIVFTKDDLDGDDLPQEIETQTKTEKDDEITSYGGIRFGYNFTRIYGKDISTDLKPGFQIGLVWEKSIPNFSVVSGLIFTTQGCQGSTSFLGKSLGAEETLKINLNYIQYQENLQFKTDWGNTNLYGRIGLYLGCAVGGRFKIEESGTVAKEEKIKFGTAKDMRRWDFGWCIGAGLQFGYAQVGLDLVNGFVNLVPNGNQRLTNVGVAVTLTFLF